MFPLGLEVVNVYRRRTITIFRGRCRKATKPIPGPRPSCLLHLSHGLLTSEATAKFIKDVNALVERLKKAAGVREGPMSQGDLNVLASATVELLTLTLANLPEPRRSETVRALSECLAIDVAKKLERIEQKIPNRRLGAPKGST
jgi:hypothetical protein